MATVFEKLYLNDQNELVALNAPISFQPDLAALEGINIHTSLEFVALKNDVYPISNTVAQKAHRDTVVWFAYYNGILKKFPCNFNRDND